MGLFSIFNKKSSEEKVSHIRILIEMATIDGEMDSKEKYMISLFAKTLKLSDMEVEKGSTLSYSQILLPKRQKDKEQLIVDLIMLMLIDNDINEKEYYFCKRIASQLSIPGTFVDNKIKEVIDNAHILLNGAYDQEKLRVDFEKILMDNISKTMNRL